MTKQPEVRITLTMPPEMNDFINDLSNDTGRSVGEVIKVSLGLMRIALNAKAEGNLIAIVTPDMEVEQEIAGF